MTRFRRVLATLTALLTFVALAAPVLAFAPAGDFPSIARKLKPRDFTVAGATAEALLVVHYHRPAGDYAGWNLWCWSEGGDGAQATLSGEDSFGRYAIVPFASASKRAGFIVRRGNWEEKDFDQDRFVTLKAGAASEIWVTSGEAAFTDDPKKLDLSLKVEGAFLDDARTITLALSRPLERKEQKGVAVFDRRGSNRELRIKSIAGDKLLRITLANDVDAADVAQLEVRFQPALIADLRPATVYARGVLEGDAFMPAADARFGAFCTRESTRFATWSPVSDAVDLLLYENAANPANPTATPTRTIPLARTAKGAWETTVAGDLHGVGYRYRFANYGEPRETTDMWAYAANADSSRTVVVDLARLEPDGFATTAAPTVAHATDEIIYETHVRDFSVRNAATPPEQRGTYLGLAHNTAYLRDLGVTAVHLLPVHDFTARSDEYNWGYWTTLFNVPESNYSTDPRDPTRAIRDLRTAITALHAAKLRVLLDVVYNHTSDAGPNAPFSAPAPYYFFRTTPAGRLTNDSGTGNGFADERPMARKYILDSLEHWLRDYKVDGFRFDLLGTHMPETVRAICARVKSIRPDATLYGEPWTGGGPTHFGKGAQKGLPIAVFNDDLRNAIRGDLDGSAVGFATGPGGDDGAIRRGVAGAIDTFTQEPTETINYADAHDNLCLWDKIEKTQPSASDATKRAMQKLALGIVLTAQGVPFIHGGSEFARTKRGDHNSYTSGDDVNAFDWQRAKDYGDVAAFTAGLAQLRRAHPAFRMSDDAEVRKALAFMNAGRTVAFTLDGRVAGDAWKRIFVAYNDEPSALDVDLPPGEWTIVVDATRAGTEQLATARGKVALPPYSMVVAHAE